MASENGWEPPKASPEQCEWIIVPGTDPPVRLELLKGQPLQILRAFAADYNAYVEHLRDPDSAARTETNSVPTSNHLNGTAMDLNWNGADGKTFRLGISEEAAYPDGKAVRLRELLVFYEKTIFCGGNWGIRDWMHFQMGGNTFNNPATADFIKRKIRADGFSTFKRDAAPPLPLPPQESYGMPTGSNSGGYGGGGVKFPAWVYQLGDAFGLRPSTYPGHQETDRPEGGFAPNPQHLNRGIDWAAPGTPDQVARMQRFADYLLSIRGHLEQVIWQNPNTGQRVGVAGGKDVTSSAYYGDDYNGHRDHVHTRQSAPIPIPGGAPPPRPSPPILSQADKYAMAIIAEGRKRGISPRGIIIALSVALVETNLTMYSNSNVPGSENLPHEKVGHDHDSTGLFQQRQAWGPLSCTMDAACSASLFFDGGKAGQRGLTDFPYNDTSVSPGTYAQKVQVSEFPDRYDRRMAEATGLYNRLTTITGGIPSQGEDDFLSALTPDEQRALYNEIMGQRPSRAALRPLGQGNIGDSTDFQLWTNGSVWDLLIMELAHLKYPPPMALALLHEISEADPVEYPDRQEDKKLAKAILLDLDKQNKPPADTPVAEQSAPTPISLSPPLPVVVEPKPEPEQYEVLPIDTNRPVPLSNTPQDLIDTMKRLKVFDTQYRKEFENLIKEEQ